MPVRLLPDTVIDQIAAGEVVERPAAVVKELFENSLDAGARAVRVHLEAGGNDLVRITDDGSGMDRHDALMCLERHATSKLRAIEDLVSVRSFGFRGEAIPSIASVSRFEILTRRADDEVGTRVVVEGGEVRAVRDAGCAPGTEIKVRELFFNMPVRRGFLRTPATELGHCVEAVVRQALLRYEVDVQVFHHGREHLRLPAAADLAGRAAAVLGATASRLRPVAFAERGIEVEGLISPPSLHDASANRLYLFVNGRYVRDPVVRRGVREAYEGLLPGGRHPVLVVAVRLPGERVDVNVHPSKIEVRFRDPRDVSEVVAAGLREALRRPEPRRRDASSGFDARPRPRTEATLPLPGLAAHPSDDPAFTPREEPELPAWLRDLSADALAGERPGPQSAADRAGAPAVDGGSGAGEADHLRSGAQPAASGRGAPDRAPEIGRFETVGPPGGAPARGPVDAALGDDPSGRGGPSGAPVDGPGGARRARAAPDPAVGSHGPGRPSGASPPAGSTGGAPRPGAPPPPAGSTGAAPLPGGSPGVSSRPGGPSAAPPPAARVGDLVLGGLLPGALAFAVDAGGLIVVDLAALAREQLARALRAGGQPERLLLPILVSVGPGAAERLTLQADALDRVGVSIAPFAPGEIAIKRVPAALIDAPWASLLAELASAVPDAPEPGIPERAVAALSAAVPELPEHLDDAAALAAAVGDLPIAAPFAGRLGPTDLRRPLS